MPSSGTSPAPIAGRARPHELIATSLALEERDAQDERDRRRLDREIGARAIAAGRGDGLAVLRAWLAEAPSPAVRDRIVRVRRALSLLRWIGLAVGLVLGWSAAAALLRIEVHAGRINVVLCVGLLVVVPFLFGLAGAIGAVWANRSATAAGTGPGGGASWRGPVLARGARAMLPQSVRDDLEVLLGRVGAIDRRVARARRALLFAWSQAIGVAFATGALTATLAFVVFTDLAFGWSTTLDVDPAGVHGLVSAFATPWASIWPEAAPSLDLVETTRHFRVTIDGPHDHAVDPIRYGAWWPFLVMSIAVYGLLPRLVLFLWAGRRADREHARAIARTPGVDRLLERLATPLVESRATEAEGEVGRPAEAGVARVSLAEWRRGPGAGALLAIAWAEALEDDALLARLARLGPAAGAPSDEIRVRDAGGRRSLEEDAARVEEARTGAGAVVLCVRAYEPPMLEVLDFLGDVRGAIGDARPLAVWLLGGEARDRDAWSRKLATLGDPGLVVVDDGAEASA